MTDDEMAQAIKRATEWVQSPEGRAELARGLKQAQEFAEEFRAACAPTWEQLNRPFTI